MTLIARRGKCPTCGHDFGNDPLEELIKRQQERNPAPIAPPPAVPAAPSSRVSVPRSILSSLVDAAEYETEYDGSMISICGACQANLDMGKHAANCDLVQARNLLAAAHPAPDEDGERLLQRAKEVLTASLKLWEGDARLWPTADKVIKPLIADIDSAMKGNSND